MLHKKYLSQLDLEQFTFKLDQKSTIHKSWHKNQNYSLRYAHYIITSVLYRMVGIVQQFLANLRLAVEYTTVPNVLCYTSN